MKHFLQLWVVWTDVAQELVALYGKERFAAMYGDAITDAGLIGILAQRASDKDFMESFMKRLFVSISGHTI